MVRNGCGYPDHKVDGWMELNFHADGNSAKLRITKYERYESQELRNNFWLAVVKNGHGTLISLNGWI